MSLSSLWITLSNITYYPVFSFLTLSVQGTYFYIVIPTLASFFMFIHFSIDITYIIAPLLTLVILITIPFPAYFTFSFSSPLFLPPFLLLVIPSPSITIFPYIFPQLFHLIYPLISPFPFLAFVLVFIFTPCCSYTRAGGGGVGIRSQSSLSSVLISITFNKFTVCLDILLNYYI